MVTLLLVPTRGERDGLGLAVPAGVEVRCCGMGPTLAAVGACRALDELRPSRCVLVGIAGTRDATRAPVGGLVVGESVVDEGVGAGAGAGFVPLADLAPPGEHVPPTTLPLDVPAAWLREDVAAGLAPPVAGAVGTVAAASASVEEADARLARRPDVLVEEMEGYAVALACRAAGVPLSVVRAVSNRAGDRDTTRWDIAGSLGSLGRLVSRLLEVAP